MSISKNLKHLMNIRSYNRKIHPNHSGNYKRNIRKTQILFTNQNGYLTNGIITAIFLVIGTALLTNIDSFSFAQNVTIQSSNNDTSDNEIFNTTLHTIQKDSIGNPQANEYNKLGMDLLNQGKYAKAIEYFDKALEIDPKSITYLLNKGISYDMLGNYDLAIQTFDKALEINPNDADVLGEKGYTLMNHKNYEEALFYF